MRKIFRNKVILILVAIGIALCLFLWGASETIWPNDSFQYSATSSLSSLGINIISNTEENIFIPTHVSVPSAVKAIYMTACVAATPIWRSSMANLIEETELNSVVIDIKDYTGTISFNSKNLLLENKNASGCVVGDMREFVEELHKRGIYVIGRITVFQDPYYVKKYPKLAVKKMSDGSVWKDYKGISFIEVGARDFWDYIVTLSKESYNLGFDELNYDYIRFPSDGNMKDIYYPFSEDRLIANPDFGKAEALRDFFAHLHEEMKETGVILSADLFGMTTTNTDDLNIGQVLEYTEPYFDYICPMVYPSHYPKGFNGYANVNLYPYEIVKFSMDSAVRRLINLELELSPMATSSPPPQATSYSLPSKLRPWLQDFDYPVEYTVEMVRAQKQATYDAGLTSWMMWDPANRYTREALD